MGYSILRTDSSKMTLVHMSVLKMGKIVDPYEKLRQIHSLVLALILEHKPDCLAIEAPFFGKNVQSMLKLGRAQGVAIAAAMHAGIDVTEYSPRKIKQSVTGNGNAAKEQVLSMLERMLSFTAQPGLLDASDALAVAVCHYLQQGPGVQKTDVKADGWKHFIKKNPGRIK